MDDLKQFQTVTPDGLRARAELVRGKLNDGGSCAAHLELAADEIASLRVQLARLERESTDNDDKIAKACALADVFQTQFLEHTAAVKKFLLELGEISGTTQGMVETDKISVQDLCTRLIEDTTQQRQWANDKSDQCANLERENQELREGLKPFAEIALVRDTDKSEPDMISGPDLVITPEHIRRARRVLEGASNG